MAKKRKQGSFDQQILTILVKGEEKLLQSSLRKMLGIPKQKLDYYIKKLTDCGFIEIEKVGRYNLLELTNRGKEFAKKNFDPKVIGYYNLLTKTRIDSYQLQAECDYVNFDYLERMYVKVPFGKGGKGFYYNLKDIPFKATIRFTNTKKIIIYMHKQEMQPTINDFTLFNRTLFKTLHALFEWLTMKQIAYVDVSTLKDNYSEIANKANETMDIMGSKQQKVTEFLDRKSKGFFTEKNHEAKAWLDKSENILELETNDIEYERKLLLMPENIFKMNKRMIYMAKNMEQMTDAIIQLQDVSSKMVEALGNKKPNVPMKPNNDNLDYMGKL